MRIRITVELSDSLRKHIGSNFNPLSPGAKTTTTKGLATRDLIREYIQARLYELDRLVTLLQETIDRPLSPVERAEADAAVSYLRAQGKSDGQIRAWILGQHARYQFPATRN